MFEKKKKIPMKTAYAKCINCFQINSNKLVRIVHENDLQLIWKQLNFIFSFVRKKLISTSTNKHFKLFAQIGL